MTIIENSFHEDIHEEIKNKLKNHVSYVLITCDAAKKDGSMSVEMSYGGDPSLAEFLVVSAQDRFDENCT